MIIQHLIGGDGGISIQVLMGEAYLLIVRAFFGGGDWNISRAGTVIRCVKKTPDNVQHFFASGLERMMKQNMFS